MGKFEVVNKQNRFISNSETDFIMKRSEIVREPMSDIDIAGRGMTPYRSKRIVKFPVSIKSAPKFNLKYKHVFYMLLGLFLILGELFLATQTKIILPGAFVYVNICIFFIVSFFVTFIYLIFITKDSGASLLWNKLLYYKKDYVKEIEDIIKAAEANTVTGGVVLNAAELRDIRYGLERLRRII